MTPQQTTAAQAAEDCTRNGYVTFPCNGKIPIPQGWQTLRASVPLTGHDSYGVVTGRGLLVVDCDGEDGTREFIELCETHGYQPPEPTCATGGDGTHYYLRVNGETRNTAKQIAQHVDTRGDGGQVIGGGSLHPNGKHYEWPNGTPPPLAELPLAPDWLVTMIGQSAPASSGNGNGRVAEGQRNMKLASVVGSRLHHAPDSTTLGEVVQYGEDWYAEHAQGQPDQGEVRRTVESITRLEVTKRVERGNQTTPSPYTLGGRMAEYALRARHNVRRNQVQVQGLDGLVLDQDGYATLDKYAEAKLYKLTRGVNKEGKPQGFDSWRHDFDELMHDSREDPALDWLQGLPPWDGDLRLHRLMPVGFGAPDTLLNRAAGRALMMQATMRTLRPGCVADLMIVITSPDQGVGKSSGLRALLPPERDEWWATSPNMSDPKLFAESVGGAIIAEVSELAAFGKTEIERIKQMISATYDTYRDPYARYATEHPRRTALVGTANAQPDEEFLPTDHSGARRFLVVRMPSVDNADVHAERVRGWVSANRDQLWAEALARVHNGEEWRLTADEAADSRNAARGAERRDEHAVDWARRIHKLWTSNSQRRPLLDWIELAEKRAAEASANPADVDGNKARPPMRGFDRSLPRQRALQTELRRLGWNNDTEWDPHRKKTVRGWALGADAYLDCDCDEYGSKVHEPDCPNAT